MVSSLEDQCRSREKTEQTHWWCCGLVYDGWAGGVKVRVEDVADQVSCDEESQAG